MTKKEYLKKSLALAAEDGVIPMTLLKNTDPETLEEEALRQYLAAQRKRKDALDTLEPEDEESEEYEAWADAHEEIEDLIDEAEDLLDEL